MTMRKALAMLHHQGLTMHKALMMLHHWGCRVKAEGRWAAAGI
jgi:hypothetical protein